MHKPVKSYRRSTPVDRMSKSVGRSSSTLRTVDGRLRSWGAGCGPGSPGEDLLTKAMAKSRAAVGVVDEVCACVKQLAEAGFVPPKRSFAVTFRVGDRVAVRPKHRGKYEKVYEKQIAEDPEMLDELIVVRTDIPGGEVVVQRRRLSPFMACKSHLRIVR